MHHICLHVLGILRISYETTRPFNTSCIIFTLRAVELLNDLLSQMKSSTCPRISHARDVTFYLPQCIEIHKPNQGLPATPPLRINGWLRLASRCLIFQQPSLHHSEVTFLFSTCEKREDYTKRTAGEDFYLNSSRKENF